MEKAKVEDLMIPVAELLAINVNDTFRDAIDALERALEDFKASKRLSRTVIVLDEQGNLVGKVSPSDILRSIEPQYNKFLNMDTSAHVGKFSYLIQSLREEVQHAALPWDRLCQTATTLKVRDIMKKPQSSQIIQVGESINEAIHLFVLGRHSTLFVTDGNNLVGMLSMATIYHAIVEKLKTECAISS